MGEFSGITGYDGWKAKLDELLTEAARVLQAIRDNAPNAADDLQTISDRLLVFEGDSNGPGCDEMDAISKATRADLNSQAIAEAIASIASRTADLQVLGKKIKEQVAKDKAKAASMRAEGLTGLLGVLHTAITTGKDLAANLEKTPTADGDKKLAEELKTALKSITDLYTKVAAAAHA